MELILEKSVRLLTSSGPSAIQRDDLLKVSERMAADGLRVLALGMRRWKFIRYRLTTNSGEVWTIFLAPFLGLPIPLLPIQILWIKPVTDGPPGLALAAEPEEKDVMRRPPRPPAEGIFAHGLGIHAVWVGLLMAGLTIGTQGGFFHAGSDRRQTMVFTVLALAQLPTSSPSARSASRSSPRGCAPTCRCWGRSSSPCSCRWPPSTCPS